MGALVDMGITHARYPATWDDFIGQGQAKRQLQVAIESAKQRGVPLNHVLLASGEPGIGKTALALLTALSMETQIKMVSGKMKENEARIALAGMEDGDVLFMDEAHRLVQGGKGNAEWILHLLADGVLMGPRGPEEQAAITVIAATTDAGKLPDTITSRFPLQPVLKPYTDDEAAIIGVRRAGALFDRPLPFPDADTLRAVARAGNNNPRTIGAILENLRDLAHVDLETVCPDATENGGQQAYVLDEALQWMGLTPDGLTEVACRYLVTLVDEFAGQAGEKAMQDRLQEAGIQSVERTLMAKGLIAKTRQGRVATRDGILRAKELMT